MHPPANLTTELDLLGDQEGSLPELPPKPSLSDRTAGGFAGMLVSTLGAKALGMLSQVVLASLLAPKFFGVVGLAYMVAGLFAVVQQAGIQQILVQRGHQWRRWSNAGFWMSLGGGCVAGLGMLTAAPFVARAYHDPLLIPLIALLAIAAPLNSLATVPNVRLVVEMRFKAQTLMALSLQVATVLLSILFAWYGMGAYSLVLPRVFTAVAQLIIVWAIAPGPVIPRLQLRRWRLLLPASGLLFLVNTCNALQNQGDYLVLGLFYATDVVGIYFFGFNLAIQVISLISLNLMSVLVPALIRLNDDPPRQLKAFLRAAGLLAAVSLPASFLQAALAGPMMRLVFPARWEPSIAVVRVLSFGMGFSVVGAMGQTILHSQGRFKRLTRLTVVATSCFFVLVLAGAMVGSRHAAVGVAWGVAVYHIFYSMLMLSAGVSEVGGGWKDVVDIYAKPLTGIVIAGLSAAVATWLLVPAGHSPGREWARAAVLLLVTIGLYLPLARRLSPATWLELKQRIASVVRVRFLQADKG